MRSMVEGAILLVQHRGGGPLHHTASRRGPPPRAGEELTSAPHPRTNPRTWVRGSTPKRPYAFSSVHCSGC
jgi:hypothetical protein